MSHGPELECWCLFHELEKAISALFELPQVPISDGTIIGAVEKVRCMCFVGGESLPLHFRAKLDRQDGTMTIWQVVHGNRSPRTIARRNAIGEVEFLEPLWSMRGLPTMAI